MTDLRNSFDILPNGAIRLKDTRIDWEHVVQLFRNGMPPEAIAGHFAYPLPLSQVYAAVTAYLLDPAGYDDYVRRGDETARRAADVYWVSLTPEQRDGQTALRNRIKGLKARFTDDHGRLDFAGLKAFLAEHPELAGAVP